MDFTGDYSREIIDVDYSDYEQLREANFDTPWDIHPQTWSAGAIKCRYDLINGLRVVTWGETRLIISDADAKKYLNPRVWLDFWQERNLPRSKELDTTRQQLAITRAQIENHDIQQYIDNFWFYKLCFLSALRTDDRDKKTDARQGNAKTGYLYQRKKGDKLVWEYRYQERNYYVSVGRYKRTKEAIGEGTRGDKILKEIFNK